MFSSISGAASFFSRIFSLTAFSSIPRPSSDIEILRSPAECHARMSILPTGGFPAATRSSGVSIPWSQALRTKCISGDSSFSRTSLSTGVFEPSISKSILLPKDFAMSRTILGRDDIPSENGRILLDNTSAYRRPAISTFLLEYSPNDSICALMSDTARWTALRASSK